MSKYYPNYIQYLGSQKCCNLNSQGPIGPAGPTGPAAIGTIGNTGPIGYTGPTGRSCKGPTGPTGSKSFVIEHPINENKYLVHVCLEGPEAGVYYRGKSEILNGEYVEVELPCYTNKLAYDFTVNITPIYKGKLIVLNAGEVENNKFKVYGENSRFHWTVFGKRYDIDVEPNKFDVSVKGEGPYLYL